MKMSDESKPENQSNMSGNVGEWSEPYVFLKLLADGKLYLGDEKLQKREDMYYPIIAIKRKEGEEELEYRRVPDANIIRIVATEHEVRDVPISEFEKNAEIVFSAIKNKTGRTFKIQELDPFFKKIEFQKLKAKNDSKADIVIIVYDRKTQTNLTLGFSIKSFLGSPPTLFNASKNTNITFRIPEISQEKVEQIIEETTVEEDSKSRILIKKRVQRIQEEGYNLIFEKVDTKIFEGNLKMIDNEFPEIIAQLLLLFYSNEKRNKIRELTEKIKEEDVFNWRNEYENPLYEYKVKNFLLSALGMVAGTAWDGKTNASGGYITIDTHGALLCTHNFDEYLFENTKLETPDKRNDFGIIYKEGNDYFIKLNLQIRYTK